MGMRFGISKSQKPVFPLIYSFKKGWRQRSAVITAPLPRLTIWKKYFSLPYILLPGKSLDSVSMFLSLKKTSFGQLYSAASSSVSFSICFILMLISNQHTKAFHIGRTGEHVIAFYKTEIISSGRE